MRKSSTIYSKTAGGIAKQTDPARIALFNDSALNPRNRILSRTRISEILNLETYQIFSESNFESAMTHVSYLRAETVSPDALKTRLACIDGVTAETISSALESGKSRNDAVSLKERSYEVLEFLGDSIIRTIVTAYLAGRFPTMDAGELSTMRAHLENRVIMTNTARRIGLDKYLLISKQHEDLRLRSHSGKILCDIYESFVGALFVDALQIDLASLQERGDAGRSASWGFVAQLYSSPAAGFAFAVCMAFVTQSLIEAPETDIASLMHHNRNYRNKMIEVCSDRDLLYVQQETLENVSSNTGAQIKDQVSVIAYLDGTPVSKGVASSRKLAESAAAKNYLDTLEESAAFDPTSIRKI